MKNLRRISFGALALVLTVPATVSAQFDSNAGGGTNLPTNSLTGIIKNLLNWLLMMVGIVGVGAFVIAGLFYLTAAGDSKVIDKAKSTMTYAVIGILVALIGLIVIGAVNSLLKGSSTI